MSQSCARIRKLPLHDQMTQKAKIDILTGHEEIVTLHLILKIIFHSLFIEKKKKKKKACIFSKFAVNYESIQYCLTTICFKKTFFLNLKR